MPKIKVRVDFSVITDIDPDLYREDWTQFCDNANSVGEGEEYPEVTENFALECFVEELNNVPELLADLTENAVVVDIVILK